ncbi:MAG: isopentenyl-diphosphate Delta-isomerase [Proteobacteria bacterium]|nr:isopentenyl-diphosphate Delta-isomerase [Pseudomonadota bacterium]
MLNTVVLVDEHDNPIGVEEKLKAHQEGLCHRAFSIFILREKNGKFETLLQQREKSKYHSGGLWTNTCCSHPKPDHDLLQDAEDRLFEEMGIRTALKEIGSFHYKADLNNGLIENEWDHVLVGICDVDAPRFNPEEVQDYRWVDFESLENDLKTHPEKYTAWLYEALQIVLHWIPYY